MIKTPWFLSTCSRLDSYLSWEQDTSSKVSDRFREITTRFQQRAFVLIFHTTTSGWQVAMWFMYSKHDQDYQDCFPASCLCCKPQHVRILNPLYCEPIPCHLSGQQCQISRIVEWGGPGLVCVCVLLSLRLQTSPMIVTTDASPVRAQPLKWQVPCREFAAMLRTMEPCRTLLHLMNVHEAYACTSWVRVGPSFIWEDRLVVEWLGGLCV